MRAGRVFSLFCATVTATTDWYFISNRSLFGWQFWRLGNPRKGAGTLKEFSVLHHDMAEGQMSLPRTETKNWAKLPSAARAPWTRLVLSYFRSSAGLDLLSAWWEKPTPSVTAHSSVRASVCPWGLCPWPLHLFKACCYCGREISTHAWRDHGWGRRGTQVLSCTGLSNVYSSSRGELPSSLSEDDWHSHFKNCNYGKNESSIRSHSILYIFRISSRDSFGN